jgi:NADPH:quinone reductase-like Zn-dependent oxidoreductase
LKLRYKILNGILGTLALAITVLALFMSHTSDCVPGPAVASDADTMQAVVYRCYGSPDDLTFEDVEKPTPDDDEVLVKVVAASVNPLDWHNLRGSPYLVRIVNGIGAPKDPRFGVDFAGTVEAVGKNVTKFAAGDDVFGGRSGAFGEYVVIPEDRGIALMPTNMSFAQAATVGVAGITALQALRDHANVQPGEKVLINGASGGVGTFAVQVAKSMGAEVTGVCSTRNVEMVLSIGADHVIDYKKESYIENDERYDVIIDNVGNHSLLSNRKAMTPNGRLVMVGGKSGNWLGPLIRPIGAFLMSPFIDQKIGMILATFRQDDLITLAELMQSGAVTPVIDRTFSLREVPDAIRYSEEGHVRGKLSITID